MKNLSICIPTFNRSKYLSELLSSISQELESCAVNASRLEICISDNASSDDTAVIVEQYSKLGLNIVYKCHPKNLGPDRNFFSAVQISSGDYCWLFGSDDLLAKGALSYVFQLIDSGKASIYLSSRANFKENNSPHEIQQWLPNCDSRYFDFRSQSDFDNYHEVAVSIGALFSYLSSIVVVSSLWKAEKIDDSYFGSAYSHAYVLLSISKRTGIFYSSQPFANNRMGNDSFLDKGAANRILIDLRGYTKLAEDIYADDANGKACTLAVLKKSRRPFITIIALRARLQGSDWEAALASLIKANYKVPNILNNDIFYLILSNILKIKHVLAAR